MRYHIFMRKNQLHHIIERIGNLLRNEDRLLGQEYGLQPIHLQALHYLSQCNRYSDTPAALTDYLGQTKGTVSQSLLVLEEKGLIKKRQDREDRRVVRLSLTASGKAVVRKSIPPPLLVEVLDSLTEKEKKNLEESLMQLLRGLQRATDSRSFGVCRTCRFFEQEGNSYRCGLTLEPLSETDSQKICREHEDVPVKR